jgi:hypothetical protein
MCRPNGWEIASHLNLARYPQKRNPRVGACHKWVRHGGRWGETPLTKVPTG